MKELSHTAISIILTQIQTLEQFPTSTKSLKEFLWSLDVKCQ